MSKYGTIVIRFGASDLYDCPQDTNLELFVDGSKLSGIYRYYLKFDGTDIWSVCRGNGFYSELPPMGKKIEWSLA